MDGLHIGDFFPELFEQALRFSSALTPITLLLVVVAVIGYGLKGINGDLSGMLHGLAAISAVAILIPTTPGIVNSIQLAIHALIEEIGAQPSDTSQEFGNLVVGNVEAGDGEVGFMDVLFSDNGGFGKAILYAVLMIASFFALVIQFLFSIAQQVLMIFGIALASIFLTFFLQNSLRGIAVKYFLGLISVATWPLAWGFADLVTHALLERAAGAGIYNRGLDGFLSTTSQSLFFAATLSIWLILSTIAAPFVMTKILREGANAGGAIIQRVGAAIGLGISYGVIGGTTAQMAGASRLKAGLAATAGVAGGAVSGGTGGASVLLPTIIGVYAAKSSIGTRGKSTDYNAKAAEFASKNKS